MNKKVYHIIAVSITIALTAGMLKVASLVLNYRYNYDECGDVPFQFYKDKMEYDVFFLGSSHTGCGIYPMQLWHDYGINSYNFGLSSASIPTSYHVLKNAIQYHSPKIVMLDTRGISFNGKITTSPMFVHYSFDIIPPSRQKYESLKDLFPDFKQRMSYILPYSLFHNRWREMTAEKAWDALFHTPVSITKGGPWLNHASTVSIPELFPKTENVLTEITVGIDYTRAFVSLCKENKIIPILITVPFPASEWSQIEENTTDILSTELGVPYYNLNKTDVIDWDTDLLDSASHVNMSGGRKVTDWIGRLLVESYGLADHRGDPAYASWHDDFQQYKHKLFDLIRSQTDIRSSLMLCNNSVYTARLSVKDGTELDSVIQKLVAQLGDAITVETIPAGEESKRDSSPTAHDIHLEVYDSETGDFITQKDWDSTARTEFVYR